MYVCFCLGGQAGVWQFPLHGLGHVFPPKHDLLNIQRRNGDLALCMRRRMRPQLSEIEFANLHSAAPSQVPAGFRLH